MYLSRGWKQRNPRPLSRKPTRRARQISLMGHPPVFERGGFRSPLGGAYTTKLNSLCRPGPPNRRMEEGIPKHLRTPDPRTPAPWTKVVLHRDMTMRRGPGILPRRRSRNSLPGRHRLAGGPGDSPPLPTWKASRKTSLLCSSGAPRGMRWKRRKRSSSAGASRESTLTRYSGTPV